MSDTSYSMPEDIVKWAVLQKRESQSQPVRLGYSCLWVPPQELGISSVSCVCFPKPLESQRSWGIWLRSSSSLALLILKQRLQCSLVITSILKLMFSTVQVKVQGNTVLKSLSRNDGIHSGDTVSLSAQLVVENPLLPFCVTLGYLCT